jgi:hypothetical protein
MNINKGHGAAVYRYSSTETGLHRAPPELWPQLGGEEVRGPSSAVVSTGVADTPAVSAGATDSAAVSAGVADSAAVEAVTAPPVPGMYCAISGKAFSRTNFSPTSHSVDEIIHFLPFPDFFVIARLYHSIRMTSVNATFEEKVLNFILYRRSMNTNSVLMYSTCMS